MPVDDFAGLVEGSTDIVDDVTGFLGGLANGAGDALNTASDFLPDFGLLGGAGDLVSGGGRSEEHTSELQSLMRISYAVFCLKKKIINKEYTEVDRRNN